jgi:uncharacterized protein (UPF0335 family)
MTDAKLKSLVERIERLMDERDGLGEDIRDVFTEVKSAGYVPKVLRKVIVRRRMDPDKRAEEDSWQELYESALDAPTRKALAMAASGATAREIESATGISRSAVSRSVPLQNDGGTTVERGGRQSPLRVGPAVTTLSCGGTLSDRASETLEATVSEGSEHQHATDDAGTARIASLGPALTDVASRCEPGPQDSLAIPSFLRRTA